MLRQHADSPTSALYCWFDLALLTMIIATRHSGNDAETEHQIPLISSLFINSHSDNTPLILHQSLYIKRVTKWLTNNSQGLSQFQSIQ